MSSSHAPHAPPGAAIGRRAPSSLSRGVPALSMPPFTKTSLPRHDPYKPHQRAPQQQQQQRQQKMKQEKNPPEQPQCISFSAASLQHQPAGVRAQLAPQPQQLPMSSSAHMPARQPIAQQKYESAAPPSGYNSNWPGNAASSFVSANDATARSQPAPERTILQQQPLPPQTLLAHPPAPRRRKPQPPKQEERTTSADQTAAAQAAAQHEEQMIKQLGRQVQELALSNSRDAAVAAANLASWKKTATSLLRELEDVDVQERQLLQALLPMPPVHPAALHETERLTLGALKRIHLAHLDGEHAEARKLEYSLLPAIGLAHKHLPPVKHNAAVALAHRARMAVAHFARVLDESKPRPPRPLSDVERELERAQHQIRVSNREIAHLDRRLVALQNEARQSSVGRALSDVQAAFERHKKQQAAVRSEQRSVGFVAEQTGRAEDQLAARMAEQVSQLIQLSERARLVRTACTDTELECSQLDDEIAEEQAANKSPDLFDLSGGEDVRRWSATARGGRTPLPLSFAGKRGTSIPIPPEEQDSEPEKPKQRRGGATKGSGSRGRGGGRGGRTEAARAQTPQPLKSKTSMSRRTTMTPAPQPFQPRRSVPTARSSGSGSDTEAISDDDDDDNDAVSILSVTGVRPLSRSSSSGRLRRPSSRSRSSTPAPPSAAAAVSDPDAPSAPLETVLSPSKMQVMSSTKRDFLESQPCVVQKMVADIATKERRSFSASQSKDNNDDNNNGDDFLQE